MKSKSWRSYFDLKMGVIGALFMGVVVFFVNIEYPLVFALTAAIKQASYTFVAGGFLMKLCENLSLRLADPLSSILLAVLTTTLVSATLTFGVHSLKGTPEPINSTLITILFAVPGFTWWAIRKRKKNKKGL